MTSPIPWNFPDDKEHQHPQDQNLGDILRRLHKWIHTHRDVQEFEQIIAWRKDRVEMWKRFVRKLQSAGLVDNDLAKKLINDPKSRVETGAHTAFYKTIQTRLNAIMVHEKWGWFDPHVDIGCLLLHEYGVDVGRFQEVVEEFRRDEAVPY